jgi:glutathione S-transferase
MSQFIVHSVPGSPFGRAVLAMLEEKGASYRLSPVAPGTFRSPEHMGRHPFGRVPVLEHNGFSLYETQATCATSTECCRRPRSPRPIPGAPRAWIRR